MKQPERVIEISVEAPIDAVWQALRDPLQIRRWFGWDYEGLEDEIELIFFTDESVAEGQGDLTVAGGDRFVLESRGQRTLVRVTRAAHFDRSDQKAIYDEIDEGWLMFVQQLRFWLERHLEEDRRTLFLTGQNPPTRRSPRRSALQMSTR